MAPLGNVNTMYTSTKQFPEFKNKNKKYADECIKYVLKKEPQLMRMFLYGVAAVVSLVMLTHLCVKYFAFPEIVSNNVGLIEIAIIVIGGYGSLLVHINKHIYPATKKHITMFEQEKNA